MHFDVFNGDADGILALVQLRLAEPKESVLVTGVKRDIALLAKLDIEQVTSVTTLDISMEKNADGLASLLAAKKPVFYVDHHRSGNIPDSSYLQSIIDLDANTCTSLLVNEHLNHAHYLWAIAAAFGDNMNKSAIALAAQHQVSEHDQTFLKALGIYVNYNGYGRTIDDLHIPPAELFKTLVGYANPLELRDDKDSVFYQLESAYQQDMANAAQAICHHDDNIAKVIELPDEAWARRVSGGLGNDLANQSPDKAHAVLTQNSDDSYTVSLRAPLTNRQGADNVCTQFATGGGRAAAAGINQLPREQLATFIDTLTAYYG
ncbi:DHH family phosphoesterase [Thalassotalea euphylliae]|uniref:DHH family phosphoesterase n=1 Tax=Thalassotalea euphylliae TaxID=1655234 RepID=A0A3E0UFK2_9GAMM|nr:DHH family phosphoesterase [Thalassotalea euphylliae]REL34925.1 DHH family phosphoesterase [Thalassotalea euphylliae]